MDRYRALAARFAKDVERAYCLAVGPRDAAAGKLHIAFEATVAGDYKAIEAMSRVRGACLASREWSSEIATAPPSRPGRKRRQITSGVVKKALTGSGAATKQDMMVACDLITGWGVAPRGLDGVADALGVAAAVMGDDAPWASAVSSLPQADIDDLSPWEY